MTDLAALAVVLGLLGGLWLLTRRARSGASGRLRTLDTLSLAPGRSLAVVRVGGRCLLVATTAQSVTQLAELDPAEWPAEEAAAAPAISPADALRGLLKRNPLRRAV